MGGLTGCIGGFCYKALIPDLEYPRMPYDMAITSPLDSMMFEKTIKAGYQYQGHERSCRWVGFYFLPLIHSINNECHRDVREIHSSRWDDFCRNDTDPWCRHNAVSCIVYCSMCRRLRGFSAQLCGTRTVHPLKLWVGWIFVHGFTPPPPNPYVSDSQVQDTRSTPPDSTLRATCDFCSMTHP